MNVLKSKEPELLNIYYIKCDTKKGSFFELQSIWAYVVLVSLNILVSSIQYVIVMALHRTQVRDKKNQYGQKFQNIEESRAGITAAYRPISEIQTIHNDVHQLLETEFFLFPHLGSM